MASLQLRLGQAVRALRSAAGFSQESFAAHIKVHRTFMGSIERGNTNVSLETLERLATGLDMSIWELMRIVETGAAADAAPAAGSRKRRPYAGRGPKSEGASPGLRKVAEDRRHS